MEYTDIFKRYELKYILSIEQYELLKNEMKNKICMDKYGESDICNLYCDTPDFLLVRRSNEKPYYKEKLRIRSYGVPTDGMNVFIEIKKKYDSIVYKRRIATDEKNAMNMIRKNSGDDSQIGREISYFVKLYKGLRPRMFISYRREAFFGRYDKELRITFDRSVLWRKKDLSLNSGIYGLPVLPENKILMEIKTASAIPLWLVEVLSKNKIYKTSFSKYGMAYTLMMKDKQKEKEGVMHV